MKHRRPLWLIAVFLLAGKEVYPMNASEPVPVAQQARLIDDFQTLDGWQTNKAPRTELTVVSAPGRHGKSLGLDYDFGKTHDFVLASKRFDLTLPENFEFSFFIRRTSPENNFEFKLIDADGNTFMKKYYRFGSIGLWKQIVFRKDEIAWAWGPNSNARLGKIAAIEFTITSGNGKGQVCFDELTLRDLPPGERSGPPVANGCCPRWLSEQQAYWTLAGAPGDEREALLCEDGTIEPHKRGFSILPLLNVNGRLVTRNEARVGQSLVQDCLPIPSVSWDYEGVAMRIQLFAHGEPGRSVAYARYSLSNAAPRKVSGRLLLLVQPYQVYPPWQGGGGLSPITRIAFSNGVVEVNNQYRIIMPETPDRFCVCNENTAPGAGARLGWWARWNPFRPQSAEDPAGLASGVIEYGFDLRPGEVRDWYVLLPLHENAKVGRGVPADPPSASNGSAGGLPAEGGTSGDQGFALPTADHASVRRIYDERLAETIEYWSRQVNRVELRVPDRDVVDTFKANISYNLVTKDGPALQPGSRSYDKAWIRDGSIAANALLEVGLTQEAHDFIEWVAGYQFDSGEVPPIIDTKAEDPLWEEKQNGLVEFDSQGEFIWIIMQYYRFTGDRAFLEKMFPKVKKDLEFMVQLRAKRLTAEYRDAPPEKRVYYGLLPESTSHEGYDMKHSYWDDFWALKGWEDARAMAVALGQTNLLSWIDGEYADFKKCVYDSIALEFKLKGIDYIPGCAELGDIDPTSTAAAIIYCEQLDSMPKAELARTFERFHEDIAARMRPGAQYRFTPYEVRSITALLRMGQKDRALKLLRFMLKHRRPLGWNHLAEVAHSDERFPCYIGDMPHTWVGAEYINAVRSLFVYERGNTLVLGAGVDPKWLEDGNPISVADLPTCFGTVSFEMKQQSGGLNVRISGTAHPPGGFVLKSPFNPAQEMSIAELPADVTISE